MPDYSDKVYPTPNHLDEYLKLDDWKIYAALKENKGGEHGDIILTRKHYKCMHQSQLIPTEEDERRIQELMRLHKNRPYYVDDKASTAWYKLDKDISVYDGHYIQPLSEKSSIVKSMSERTVQKRFYLAREE